jgi:hypothetical protein
MAFGGFAIGLVCALIAIAPAGSLSYYSSARMLSFMSGQIDVASRESTVEKLPRGIAERAHNSKRMSVAPSKVSMTTLPRREQIEVPVQRSDTTSMRLAAFVIDPVRPRAQTVSLPVTTNKPTIAAALSHTPPVPHRNTVSRVLSIIRKYAPKNQNPHILADSIVRESRRQGYDPLFVAAVIKSESTFNPAARSHKGAQGLMQIMPATGAWLQAKNDIPRGKLTDPGHNLRLGITYLKYLEGEFSGNKMFTLVAYNWGPGHVQSATGGKARIPKECMTYALKILNDYQRWQSGLI